MDKTEYLNMRTKEKKWQLHFHKEYGLQIGATTVRAFMNEFDQLIKDTKEECAKEVDKEIREDYKNAFTVAINKILKKIAKAIRDSK